jgi:hypothetical protein
MQQDRAPHTHQIERLNEYRFPVSGFCHTTLLHDDAAVTRPMISPQFTGSARRARRCRAAVARSQRHFLECNALLAMLKLEAGEPVDVRPPPGFLARIMTTETQQKRGDVLAFASVVLDRRIASPHEVRIAS